MVTISSRQAFEPRSAKERCLGKAIMLLVCCQPRRALGLAADGVSSLTPSGNHVNNKRLLQFN
ncbi:MAG: hypothetical protein ACRC7H_06980 [Plesiomonas shigelloides]